MPVAVATKTVAGSVGWTRISLMALPVKAPVTTEPLKVWFGLMGPVRVAVVFALLMR